MPHLPPVTKFLMLACTAVFCLQLLLPMAGVPVGDWFALWTLNTGHFLPWQPLTYAFLETDVVQLFFNMLGLWMFGAELEMLWGSRRYGQYLGASVLTGAATLLLLGVAGAFARVVGLSAGLYGLLLASALLFPDRTIMPLFPPIPMKMKVFALVFGAITLLFALFGGGIAQFTHLGGALGGYLMIRYWRGQPPFGGRGGKGGGSGGKKNHLRRVH